MLLLLSFDKVGATFNILSMLSVAIRKTFSEHSFYLFSFFRFWCVTIENLYVATAMHAARIKSNEMEYGSGEPGSFTEGHIHSSIIHTDTWNQGQTYPKLWKSSAMITVWLAIIRLLIILLMMALSWSWSWFTVIIYHSRFHCFIQMLMDVVRNISTEKKFKPTFN